jgi:hypothetical protein
MATSRPALSLTVPFHALSSFSTVRQATFTTFSHLTPQDASHKVALLGIKGIPLAQQGVQDHPAAPNVCCLGIVAAPAAGAATAAASNGAACVAACAAGASASGAGGLGLAVVLPPTALDITSDAM